MNANNYFQNCTTLDDAKKLYWELAKKLHPDIGGTTAGFQDLQNQFENFTPKTEKFENEYDLFSFKGFEDLLNALIKIQGIKIVVAGSWVWLEGDTYEVKDQIKAVPVEGTGFKRGFSRKKSQWYFSPEGYRKRSKRELSIDEIYSLYGHKKVSKDEEKRQQLAYS